MVTVEEKFDRGNPAKDFGKDCGGFFPDCRNKNGRFGGKDHDDVFELAFPGI